MKLRMSTVCLVATLLVIGAGAPVWSGVIRHDRTDADYLTLGADPAFASVGHVTITTPGPTYVASGTVIAEDWVLTAGHVVDDATALTFVVNGETRSATNWVAHSKWNGNLGSGYDIALFHLDSAVSVAPAARYDGKNEVGSVGVSVGYGTTGTGLTGEVTYDGQKRAGENAIDMWYAVRGKTGRMFLSDFDNPLDPGDSAYGSSSPLDLEYLIGGGDSGGGVFIEVGGQWQLAGVHSFGASFDGETDSDYGDVSGHTRVSVFNGWIDDVIGGGGGGGKPGKPGKPDKPGKPPKGNALLLDGFEAYTKPLPMTAIPEPAAATLLLLGALGLRRRRR